MKKEFFSLYFFFESGKPHYAPTAMLWNEIDLKQDLQILTLQPMMLIIVTALICKRKSHYASFVFLLIISAHHSDMLVCAHYIPLLSADKMYS